MPRWIVTERTSVDADDADHAVERVVTSTEGYQDIIEQSAVPQEDGRPHSAYFTGNIEEALKEVCRSRGGILMFDDGEMLTVHVLESDRTSVAEWGRANTPNEALRYALGAFFA